MTSSPPARSFDWPNLRLRILSAAVLAPVAIVCVSVGGAPFLVLLAIVDALLALEWGRMAGRGGPPSAAAALIATAVLTSIFVAYTGWWRSAWILLPAGSALAAIVARIAGWSNRSMDVAFGVLYLGAPSLSLLWLRSGDSGLAWTLLLLAVTWAADIAAFAAGTAIGGPKLWPRFSPNKTWAGFCAGLAAACLAAVGVVAALRSRGGPVIYAGAWLGLLGGLATMAGDLWESMLKRRFGVKDSGDLIPGHGGLLDRVDGMMFATLAIAAARLTAEFGLWR